MCRDSWDAEASAYLVGDLVREVDGLLRRNHGQLCGGAERAIGLRSEQPHATADSAGVDTRAD
ncbi:MAG: hypothetical protein QOF87_2312 [Pseudonocardiales bacterium]|jgi:hypothetical protein|nr:hypothetical protein [Pseudonocardiales bacterium]